MVFTVAMLINLGEFAHYGKILIFFIIWAEFVVLEFFNV